MNYYREHSENNHPYSSSVPQPLVSSLNYDESDGPAVVLLQSSNDNLLSLKVEPDIMAYILYCYYNEFAKIQQTYHVAITWSGMDNTVMFCAVSMSEASQLHLAVQQFTSFYYHISSNLVVALLDKHVRNITLHQYHKATFEVKKHHAKAMIKEIKTTGRIALYCPVNEVAKVTKTFLSTLKHLDSPKSTSKSPKRQSPERIPTQSSNTGHLNRPKNQSHKYFTLPHTMAQEWKQKPYIYAEENPQIYPNAPLHLTHPAYYKYNSGTLRLEKSFYPEETLLERRNTMERPRFFEETASSNGSSGYGSNNGTLNGHHRLNDVTIQQRAHSDGYFHHSKRNPLPPIANPSSLNFGLQQESRSTLEKTYQNILREPSTSDNYYYDDIQHSGEVSLPAFERPSTHGRVIGSYKSKHLYNESSNAGKPMYGYSNTVSHTLHSKSLARLQANNQQTSKVSRARQAPSPLLNKPSIIPVMKSAFRFQQHHKKHFEITTPTGVTIEVYEGDLTDADCDVIVNQTNSQLHVAGELAWAVAKHGSFEIPKLTKLHVSMHGPVMESKVVVTPGVLLPSAHVIHAVVPQWRENASRKSRKLLYNTYKNVFTMANEELGATSIALPVIGLEKESKSSDSFPFHVATEIMYQTLIAFLKVGSPTLRHIRYIDSNPDHVNLIVTSIKPKIENVTYDPRFLQQYRLQTNRVAMNSFSSFNSYDVNKDYRNGLSPFTVSTAESRTISPDRFNKEYKSVAATKGNTKMRNRRR